MEQNASLPVQRIHDTRSEDTGLPHTSAEAEESPHPPTEEPDAEGSTLSEERIAEVERLVHERAIVEVDVVERIRGGLRVLYQGISGFLPTSLATAKRYPAESELRELIGQRLHVIAHELRRSEQGTFTLVFSRRHFLEDLALARLQVGQEVEGVVTRLTTFGAFVDIGGIEGLIPLAELDHVPVSTPSKVLQLGQSVRTKVISIDLGKRQVRLSRRALLPSPWEGIEQRYPVGSRVRGIVRRVVPKAAFVQLEPGIDGIVPVEELSWIQRIPHPSHLLSAGQEAEFVVLEVSAERKRLVLSLRRTQPNPWDEAAERYPVGSRVEVTVRRLTQTAAHVELDTGLAGIIPATELSWSQARPAPSSILQVGQRIEAVVLQLEPHRQLLVLSYRRAHPDPWEGIAERLSVGTRVRGTVRRVLPRSAVVEIAEGVEGFIPLSELSWTRRPLHTAELLHSGQEVECVVMELDPAARRLVLSLRQAQPSPWHELAERYPVGSEQEATFLRMQPAGALVRLGTEVDAFMPRSSFAPLLRKTKEPWKPGEHLRVRIVELNPEESSLVVEPLLELKPAVVPNTSSRKPSRPAASLPRSQPQPTGAKSPQQRPEKRTATTLAELLPEEIRQKLLQTLQK